MIALLPVVLALSVPLSDPIIRRDDRPDSAYCNLGAQARALVSFGRAGDGTLIGSRWVLTAGHIARSLSMRQPEMRSVDVGGATYAVQETFVHPEWTEMGPHDRTLISASGRGVTLLSHAHAKGPLPPSGQAVGTGATPDRIEDGKARGATSRVDSVNAQWLYFSFDAPSSGTELEGAPGAGDSGGPAIVVIDGMPFVAGVSSAGYDGVNGPGSYGAVDVFTRVSTHAAWIDKVMMAATSGPPGNASGRPSGRGNGGRGSRGPRR